MGKWNIKKLSLSHLPCKKQSYFKYDTSDIPLTFQISNKYPHDKSQSFKLSHAFKYALYACSRQSLTAILRFFICLDLHLTRDMSCRRLHGKETMQLVTFFDRLNKIVVKDTLWSEKRLVLWPQIFYHSRHHIYLLLHCRQE